MVYRPYWAKYVSHVTSVIMVWFELGCVHVTSVIMVWFELGCVHMILFVFVHV